MIKRETVGNVVRQWGTYLTCCRTRFVVVLARSGFGGCTSQYYSTADATIRDRDNEAIANYDHWCLARIFAGRMQLGITRFFK